MSSGKKGLVAGAFSLAMAGFVSRILGVIYIVPFQNMAKDYAMGLYSMAYSIYVVMLMVATAGIPLAMSKLISEKNAVGDYAGADQIYRVGARYLSLAGLLIFLLMWASGGVVAVLMGDYGSSTAVRTLAFAVLVVPLLSAMRGYVQGHQEMAYSGNAQVVEQLVRVVVILAGVFIAVKLGAQARITAAVATSGAVLGAVASLFFLARHVVRIRRENRKRFMRPASEPNKKVFRRILQVAVPITLTSLVYPLSQLVDSLTITNLLVYGQDLLREQAATEYGIFTARALRLVALPLSLAVAVGTSVMPAIAEAMAQKDLKLRNARVVTSFRLTGFFAFPMAVGMFLLAAPIDIALFQDTQGAFAIALTAFMAIFASYEVVAAYILQSLGHMYLPIRYMFAGLALKLVLNLALVPFYGINGAAAASVLGYVLSAVLSLAAIRRVTQVQLSKRELYLKPLLASLVMGAAVWVWSWVPLEGLLPAWPRIANLLVVLGGGLIGAVLFFGVMVLLKGISKDEMRRLPVIKKLVR